MKKEEQVKEEKKKKNEEKEDKTEYVEYYSRKERQSSNAWYIVIIVILLCVLITLAFFLGLKLSEKNSNSNSTSKATIGNVELDYTESVKTQTDGVYITDVSEVVDKVMPSIVAITSKTVISSGRFGPNMNSSSGKYTSEGAGSGVIVSENDDEIFILTNYHVVEGTDELSVKFIDDKSYDAKIKGVSERKDIAIVSVSKKDIDSSTLEQIKIATLGSSDDLKVGNGIIAIGNALGYGQSVTTGVVSALNREIKTDDYSQKMIQIDAAINGGNSGGALLNNKGEVVGINTAKYSSSGYITSASIEGMGFAIPISDVKDILENLINGENDDSAMTLGIEGYMTNSNYRLPSGFYISSITEGGNADSSELEIGNIITEVDGNQVTSVDTIKKVLNQKNKGDKITLKVMYVSKNEYKEKEVTIKLS